MCPPLPRLPDSRPRILVSGFMSLLDVSPPFHVRGLDSSLSQLIKNPCLGWQPWTYCSDKSYPSPSRETGAYLRGAGPLLCPLLWETWGCCPWTTSPPPHLSRGFVRQREGGVTQGKPRGYEGHPRHLLKATVGLCSSLRHLRWLPFGPCDKLSTDKLSA